MLSIKRVRTIAAASALVLLVTVTTGLFVGSETRRQFVEISQSWTGFAEDAERKGVWISSLRGHLGYGGIIHTFKNYVIRQDEDYRLRMLDQLAQFDAVMTGYLAEPLPTAERRALETIRETIDLYHSKIPIAQQAAAGKWPPERTDRLVRVDDTAAVDALADLERLWLDARGTTMQRIVAAVAQGQALIVVGYLSMAALVMAAGVLGLLIGILIRDLRRAAAEASAALAARLAVERSEQRLAQAVEQSPATIMITDRRGRIDYVNRRFEVLSGWSRDEVIGRTPRFLQSGDTSAEEYAAMRARLDAGESWQGLLHNMRKDGGGYWVDATILPLRAADGSAHSLLGIGEDVTEKRAAREQVNRAQKIEAVGLIAGGLAHDFNNILTAIIGSAHLAGLDAPEDSDLAAEIEQIDIAARRAQSLVRQLLGVARRESGRAVPTDLGMVVREVQRLMRAALPPSITLAGPSEPGPLTVLADPTHIHQILMNLYANAADAIGGGHGRIEIAMRHRERTPEGMPDRTAGWVELAVADTGHGMTEETAARIFDPFYTTKPLGKGTGLGLAVVQGLVQDIGGRITVESAPGRGTTFTLILPGADAAGQEAADAATPVAGGHETLLVVDDQPEVAATLRRALIRLGYQVEAFTSPLAALERFNAAPRRHRLLISDIVMPEMSGPEMARRMREVRPDLPVILCTGFNPTGVALAGSLTMRKPIDPVDLSRAVRDLLDADADADADAVPRLQR